MPPITNNGPGAPRTPTPRPTGNAHTSGATGADTTASTTGTAGITTVTNHGDGDSVSRTGGSSSGGRLSRVKDKLIEKTWDELQSRHSVSGSIDLGSNGALGVRLSERVILGESSYVRNDPARKATTEKLARDTGESVFWLETGGVMDADVGLSKSVPVSGVVNLHGGFNAKAVLEYRALNPHTASTGAVAKDLLKNHTVKVPVDADRARELLPGTQVELLGRGTATLSAGVGAGTSSSVGSLTGNANIGVGVSGTRTGTWAVQVTRLQGEKVRVVLSDVQTRTRNANVSASAGLTIDGDEVIDDSLGGSIDAASESVGLDGLDDVPGVGDDGVSGLVQKQGAKVIEKAVKRYTAFHASKGRSASETREDVTSYVLDLSNPQARKAYDELLKLDESAASRLSQQTGAGISRHVYAGTTTATGQNARVTFAGKKLLLFNALRAESQGQLSTSSGTQLIRTSRYARNYSGILTGKRDIRWEGVQVKNAETGASEHFFHMRFSKDDKITHNSEVREFVRFADFLGAEDADERTVDTPDGNWISRLFGSDDNSRVNADVYFTDTGVRKLASSSRAEVVGATVAASMAVDHDLGTIPIDNAGALTLMREHNKLQSQIDELDRFAGSSDQDEVRDLKYLQWKLSKDYEKLGFPKKKLDDHAEVVRAGDKLADAFAKMDSDEDGAWTEVFADLGQANKFDYMVSIGAIAKLAGADQTLLHEVSFEGGGTHLRSLDEGKLTHPTTTVSGATTGHS